MARGISEFLRLRKTTYTQPMYHNNVPKEKHASKVIHQQPECNGKLRDTHKAEPTFDGHRIKVEVSIVKLILVPIFKVDHTRPQQFQHTLIHVPKAQKIQQGIVEFVESRRGGVLFLGHFFLVFVNESLQAGFGEARWTSTFCLGHLVANIQEFLPLAKRHNHPIVLALLHGLGQLFNVRLSFGNRLQDVSISSILVTHSATFGNLDRRDCVGRRRRVHGYYSTDWRRAIDNWWFVVVECGSGSVGWRACGSIHVTDLETLYVPINHSPRFSGDLAF
jgi:hypothetical protein